MLGRRFPSAEMLILFFVTQMRTHRDFSFPNEGWALPHGLTVL